MGCLSAALPAYKGQPRVRDQIKPLSRLHHPSHPRCPLPALHKALNFRKPDQSNFFYNGQFLSCILWRCTARKTTIAKEHFGVHNFSLNLVERDGSFPNTHIKLSNRGEMKNKNKTENAVYDGGCKGKAKTSIWTSTPKYFVSLKSHHSLPCDSELL